MPACRGGSPIVCASGFDGLRVIGGRRPLQGQKPGDRRVRVDRPHAALFRWTGPGQLTAKEAASIPTTHRGRLFARAKAVLLGRPLASEEEIGERLSKKKALAIFSSDAISSSAYATEEILRVLILGGVAAMAWGLWVSAAIAVLLIAVAFSYRQVCLAYPTGGGSYSVSKRNFGQLVSLVAASALMIDYVMTVAVSTASAIEQVTSAVPALVDERVILGIAVIALITVGNLRGLREAGNIFAIPTYLFVGSAILMIAIGTFRIVVLGEHGTYNETVLAQQVGESFQSLTLILLLRAFLRGSRRPWIAQEYGVPHRGQPASEIRAQSRADGTQAALPRRRRHVCAVDSALLARVHPQDR